MKTFIVIYCKVEQCFRLCVQKNFLSVMIKRSFSAASSTVVEYLRSTPMRMKYKTRLVVFGVGLAITVTVFITSASTMFYLDPNKPLTSKKLTLKSRSNLSMMNDNLQNAVLGFRKFDENPKKSEEYHDDENVIEDNTKSKDLRHKKKQKSENLASMRIPMKDPDIDKLLYLLQRNDDLGSTVEKLLKYSFKKLADNLGKDVRQKAPGFSGYRHVELEGTTNFERFHIGIKKHSLYDPDDPSINGLLHDMATMPFESAETMKKGTELKLLIYLLDGTRAVFKPMRWPRDYETLPNHYYFNDYERHNAEIAAFHLDRVLGFYRVPPVTGRIVNMTTEIYDIADRTLRKTFYWSPVNNLCFFGECTYYCDSRHSFCGNGDMIEGSLMVYLPPEQIALRQRWKSPYRRSYSKFRKAEWETDESYCKGVISKSPYNKGRFLLDIIDMHIFDFLTGNMDRHHVEIFREFGNYSFLIHLDNGRGFGKTQHDEFSILAPLRQCCVIRLSTFVKFAKLYVGPDRLSTILDFSLKSDPVYPVLTEGHLNALDRRVLHVLRTVARCVDKMKSVYQVIVKDKF